jgi:hypothetical protein
MLQKLTYLNIYSLIYEKLFDYKREISMISYTFTKKKNKYV